MRSGNGKIIIEGKDLGLYFRNRRKIFSFREPEFWAIKNISFQLKEGECLGIVGKNGAGKSTLMKVIAGLVKPDRGELINPGFRVVLLALGVGFIPQLSGRDNVILSGMLQGLSRKEILAKLDKIEEFSEISDFIDEPVFTYSSGMRARLAFSVAIESNADVILIDEVLGVGDLRFREKSNRRMHRLLRSGKTVVLISHNTNVIKELCDRALWIHKGISVQQGKTDEVVKAYEERLGKQSKRRRNKLNS